MTDLERQLEELYKRKHDAEAINIFCQPKWLPEYIKVCVKILQINKQLGLPTWDESYCLAFLIQVNNEIAKELNWEVHFEYYKVSQAADNLDTVFKTKDTDKVLGAIKSYKQTFIDAYNQTCKKQVKEY